MSIIAWIIVGIIAGWIAEKIMGRNDGLLMNLVIGVVAGGYALTALVYGTASTRRTGSDPEPALPGAVAD